MNIVPLSVLAAVIYSRFAIIFVCPCWQTLDYRLLGTSLLAYCLKPNPLSINGLTLSLNDATHSVSMILKLLIKMLKCILISTFPV